MAVTIEDQVGQNCCNYCVHTYFVNGRVKFVRNGIPRLMTLTIKKSKIRT